MYSPTSPGHAANLSMTDEAINQRALERQKRRLARERERQKYNIQLDTSVVSSDLANSFTYDTPGSQMFASPASQAPSPVPFRSSPTTGERSSRSRSRKDTAEATAVVTVTTPKKKIRKGTKPMRCNVAMTVEVLERAENSSFASVKVVSTAHGDVHALTKHTPREIRVKIARSAFPDEASPQLAQFKCCLLAYIAVDPSMGNPSAPNASDKPITTRELPVQQANLSPDGRSVYMVLGWSSSLDAHLFARDDNGAPLVPLSISVDLELAGVLEPIRLSKPLTAKVYASEDKNPYSLYPACVSAALGGDVYHALMNMHPAYTVPYKLFLCDQPDERSGLHSVAALRRRVPGEDKDGKSGKSPDKSR